MCSMGRMPQTPKLSASESSVFASQLDPEIQIPSSLGVSGWVKNGSMVLQYYISYISYSTKSTSELSELSE